MPDLEFVGISTFALLVYTFNALSIIRYSYLESGWKKPSNLIEILSKAVDIQNRIINETISVKPNLGKE